MNHKDPLHGITLERILTEMVERHGWDYLGEHIRVRCFNFDPSIKSSLTFLRKTPWARKKLEEWYIYEMEEDAREAEKTTRASQVGKTENDQPSKNHEAQ